MRIAGTFLDEITHDIPSNNWGMAEGGVLLQFRPFEIKTPRARAK